MTLFCQVCSGEEDFAEFGISCVCGASASVYFGVSEDFGLSRREGASAKVLELFERFVLQHCLLSVCSACDCCDCHHAGSERTKKGDEGKKRKENVLERKKRKENFSSELSLS